MNRKQLKIVIALTAALGVAGSVHAKATPDEIAQIGKKYTCTGAEKAGTASGVAEFTGKYLGAMPGMIPNGETGKHQTDPYAAEKPLFTITAQNLAQYADKLSEGQKAMFKKYPNSYKMNVYQSHRDFRYDDSICKAALHNAQHAEVVADGMTANNAVRGAAPFPFPKTGAELVYNVLMPPRTTTIYRDTDLAIVYANGNVLWGWQKQWGYSAANDIKLRGQKYEGISAYNKIVTLLPEREKGNNTKTLDYFDFKEPRGIWQYLASTRRIRQAPGFAFDMPNPSAAGTITIDDTRLMNGSPERYNWKIVGKKEVYLPANNFKLESKEVGDDKYKKLLTPGHENPEFVRWELRRAWILEATLKEGYRHLYPNRTMYVDEDNSLATMADNFDARGNIWRFNWINNLYVGGARTNTYEAYSAYYHDLNTGNYTVYDLTQAKPHSLYVDPANVDYSRPDFYSTESLKTD